MSGLELVARHHTPWGLPPSWGGMWPETPATRPALTAVLRLGSRSSMLGDRRRKGSAAMDARALCAGLRRDLADVEECIEDNSWLGELEAGRLSTGALRAFAGEQLQIIPSDLRSFEVLIQRFAADPAHGYLADLAAGERAALYALEAFATAVGLDGPQRQAYEPVPGCQVYPSYVARLARDGTPAQIAGAFLVNLDAWGSCCARMADALPSTYQLSRADCAFFAHFAGPTTELERTSLEVIDAGLAQGVDPAAIARAARLLQAYELLFWNSLPR
ncbi:MAG: transcriptional regulator [Pseudonocardiales bacterium]|nr:transcriptional regulator [Pseudonocardiales bacterium]MBV9031660.1 transcriptional regulator [Pseudonocardiales bacterium]